MSNSRPACEDVRADLGELAVGVLDGRARAHVLAHVNDCTACRGELEALTGVSDLLVALAPESDPPVGFESRLVERYHREARASRAWGARHRRVRAGAMAGAALVLVLGGVALGYRGGHDTTYSAGAAPRSVALVAHGRGVGQLWMSAGSPAWIYVSFENGHTSGAAWCSVTLRDGRVLDVGVFRLRAGYGAWSARVSAASGDVRSARITDDAGRVLATATVAA